MDVAGVDEEGLLALSVVDAVHCDAKFARIREFERRVVREVEFLEVRGFAADSPAFLVESAAHFLRYLAVAESSSHFRSPSQTGA